MNGSLRTKLFSEKTSIEMHRLDWNDNEKTQRQYGDKNLA